MSLPSALEILLSLTAQVAILYFATGWIERRESSDESKDRLWNAFYILVLTLTVFAWAGPHLRILPVSVFLESENVVKVLDWQTYIAWAALSVWGAGVIIGFTALLLGMLKSMNILRATDPIEPDLQRALLAGIKTNSHSRHTVKLRTTDKLMSPYCWQLYQPLIVLPRALLSASFDMVHTIVGHEISHLRANHPFYLFLQRLVEILYWYHPAVWRASRRAALQREFIADGGAVRSRTEAIEYLKGLMMLAECQAASPNLPIGLALKESASQIQERIQRLVARDWNSTQRAVQNRWIIKFAAIACLCMVTWLPISVAASSRGLWSPWPQWSAGALRELGIEVRDYEIDSHRVLHHHHDVSLH
jgi:beta-lactamase regulating signal transducer with metallopeptidase domain